MGRNSGGWWAFSEAGIAKYDIQPGIAIETEDQIIGYR